MGVSSSSTGSEDSGANLSSLPSASTKELSRIHLFKELAPRDLEELEGGIRRVMADPDETIMELLTADRPFRYFLFIASGHVKITGYDEEARTRPLNFLRKGEYFVDKSIAWGGQIATRAVAMTHSEILLVPRERLRNLARRRRDFHEKLTHLTERIDFRNRLFSEDRYARSVLEFLIDKELTQASRVKITRLDKCIECNTCYTSCEERHGFQRLERGYARFGVLDFAKSCITCFYPTCIPACPVDSVVFDTARGEIEILDACIGCSACVHACQYGAISMHKVEPENDFFARFLHDDKKIKPKFVADKCDHCVGYEDMVCITNCPTGAIFEASSMDLLENPTIFGAEGQEWHALPSLMTRSGVEQFLQGLYILIGFAVTLLLVWEASALSQFPHLSILKTLQSSGAIPADFSFEFRRGSEFCFLLGNIGFTLILGALIYPLRKGFPRLFKYFGPKPIWLDFHNFCGLLGTVLVVFHTGFSFPLQPSTFGLFALVGVALSGVFGRFLYHMIPRGVAGTELKLRDIEEEDVAITRKLDALFGEAQEVKALVTRIISSLTNDAQADPTLRSLIFSVVKTRWWLFSLRFRMPREVRMSARQIGVFLDLLSQKIRLQRNVAFLAVSSRLFATWQLVHRPLAYVMSAIALGHIIFNLFFFGGR